MRRKLIFIAPLAILGVLAFITLGGLLVMWLWNWLLPSLFGFRSIGFWQAVGLLALCRILFGRTGWRGPGRSGVRRRMRERMEERWGRMTPEERERFREHFRARWGWVPPAREEGINPEPPRTD